MNLIDFQMSRNSLHISDERIAVMMEDYVFQMLEVKKGEASRKRYLLKTYLIKSNGNNAKE